VAGKIINLIKMIDIAKTIEENKLTQAAFARLIGRDRSHVNKWLLGKITPSKLMQESIRTICKHNNLKIVDFES